MNIWQYIEAHPWWGLTYLIFAGSILIGIASALKGFVVHNSSNDWSKTETHNHSHNWPRDAKAERLGDKFTVNLPHPESCCRHKAGNC